MTIRQLLEALEVGRELIEMQNPFAGSPDPDPGTGSGTGPGRAPASDAATAPGVFQGMDPRNFPWLVARGDGTFELNEQMARA